MSIFFSSASREAFQSRPDRRPGLVPPQPPLFRTSVGLYVVSDETCKARPLILEGDDAISPCFPLLPNSSMPSSQTYRAVCTGPVKGSSHVDIRSKDVPIRRLIVYCLFVGSDPAATKRRLLNWQRGDDQCCNRRATESQESREFSAGVQIRGRSRSRCASAPMANCEVLTSAEF
jgi:hypothetical protein